MERLPNEVLTLILRSCPIQEWQSLSLVSRKWKAVTETLWDSTRKLNLNGLEHDFKLRQILCCSVDVLACLELSRVELISPGYAKIFPDAKNLRRLAISESYLSKENADSILSSVGACGVKILTWTSVSIRPDRESSPKYRKPGNAGLQNIIPSPRASLSDDPSDFVSEIFGQKVTGLEILELENACLLGPDFLGLCRNLSDTLKSLSMKERRSRIHVSDFQEGLSELVNLEELKLVGGSKTRKSLAHFVTDDFASDLTEKLTNLESVTLEGAKKLTETGLKHFFELRSLKSIALSGSPKIGQAELSNCCWRRRSLGHPPLASVLLDPPTSAGNDSEGSESI